jgi:spermidine synthase
MTLNTAGGNKLAMPKAEQDAVRSWEIATLVYSVFAAGLCSIVYELLIATTVSYFEGDSVKFFSITIGLYMASMGAGAYVSKFVKGNLLTILVGSEILLGFLGGFSVPVLYAAFTFTDFPLAIYVILTLSVGFLIGLEIPFLTRILEEYDSLRVSIAHVLTLDYVGALIATAAFPFVLLPFFGVFQSSLFFGLVNMTIGLFLIWVFPDRFSALFSAIYKVLTLVITAAIVGTIIYSDAVLAIWNNSVFDGRIVHSQRTPYQQIVLTKYRDDLRLYLNGNIQFSSVDEYRYHEALIHIPLAAQLGSGSGRKDLKVLLLGGGDGLAVREVLKYDAVARVTLVDLDPAIIKLAKTNPYLTGLNENSLTRDPRVRVLSMDAMSFLRERKELYDVIIADLPDPNNLELARLYSRAFFRIIRGNLAPDGIFVTQATSPNYARKAFWSIRKTVATEFTHVYPYHLLIPSFGDWGFIMASARQLDPKTFKFDARVGRKYLDEAMLPGLFVFERDLKSGNEEVEINTLDRPQLLQYYLDGWHHWGR